MKETGKRLEELLTFTFPDGVTSKATMKQDNLLMDVHWPRPLPGRPNAFATLHILIARETVHDCFQYEDLTGTVNSRFVAFIRGKMAHYIPTPSSTGGADPEPEVWKVLPADVCVGFGD